jgi:hypothetical protein
LPLSHVEPQEDIRYHFSSMQHHLNQVPFYHQAPHHHHLNGHLNYQHLSASCCPAGSDTL